MMPGETFHLYNHANGCDNIFIQEKNYAFFLAKMAKHILPVCKIFAYCLMPNHFHLVLQVMDENELQNLWCKNPQADLNEKEAELKVSKTFANFFSSYTQAFNKVYNRKGSLFIPSMKTRLITSENDFCNIIHYVHANPVHHRFTKTIEEWPHSSYGTFLSPKPTKLEREYVLDAFGGLLRL